MHLPMMVAGFQICLQPHAQSQMPERAPEDPVAGNFKIRKKPDQVIVSGQHLSPPACPAFRVMKQEHCRALAASRILCSGQKPAMLPSCSSVCCDERGMGWGGADARIPARVLLLFYSDKAAGSQGQVWLKVTAMTSSLASGG